MSSESAAIQPRSQVRLHLEIHLEEGTEALSTLGEEPLDCTLGDGTLVPGLERLLLGLEPGADVRFLADGSYLYGSRSEEKIHWLPREGFPEDPTPGQVVAFGAPGGQETAGIVLATESDRVQVDFNHPLSGRSLRIRVHILAVSNLNKAQENP
ncbi:MAG: FKBP-type peptidyl-prolyl cis-trans isomerase [Pseudomonadota bacterium]|nr:FKBP-type peptidyl-prolyl cis-trans isomerase [Pseudomonadota bacterium]